MRKAYIRDWSAVSAFGKHTEAFWPSLLGDTTATRKMSLCPSPRKRAWAAAEVPLDPISLSVPDPVARAVQLADLAAEQLLADRTFPDPERVGLVLGTGVGNLDLVGHTYFSVTNGRDVAPTTAFQAFAHTIACRISRDYGIEGPILTVTSGCNSGADAIGVGLDWLRAGRVDFVVVGGVEAEINPLFLEAMIACRALASGFEDRPEAASRPFDVFRSGNVPGEGAALALLTNESVGARGLLHGYACRSAGRRPTYSPFNPVHDLGTISRTWNGALRDANMSARELRAYSANGSSSVFYDRLEGEALLAWEECQGMPIFSIKGHLGQTGAVTPLFQLISAACACEDSVLPQIANLEEPEPSLLGLRFCRALKKFESGPILCNAIGFGGQYYSAFVVGPAS